MTIWKLIDEYPPPTNKKILVTNGKEIGITKLKKYENKFYLQFGYTELVAPARWWAELPRLPK